MPSTNVFRLISLILFVSATSLSLFAWLSGRDTNDNRAVSELDVPDSQDQSTINPADSVSTFEYMVALRDIEIGEVVVQSLQTLDAAEVSAGLRNSPSFAFIDTENEIVGGMLSESDIAGRRAARFIPSGSILTESMFTRQVSPASTVLKEGERGVTIPVDDISSSGFYVLPGDRVDLVLLAPQTQIGQDRFDPFVQTILSGVRVIAIGSALDETGSSNSIRSEGRFAVLAIHKDFVDQVVASEMLGRLRLILMSEADQTVLNESAHESHHIIEPANALLLSDVYQQAIEPETTDRTENVETASRTADDRLGAQNPSVIVINAGSQTSSVQLD